MTTALTRTERARFVELKSKIAQAFQHIEEKAEAVGRWLREIKDNELWREEYDNWLDFVDAQRCLGYSRRRCYQLLEYADVLDDVCTSGTNSDPRPNERQARELAAAPSEARAPLWKATTEGERNPSAAHIGKLVDAIEQNLERLEAQPPEVQRAVIREAEERLHSTAHEDRTVTASHAERVAAAVKMADKLRVSVEKIDCPGAGLVLKRIHGVKVALLALAPPTE